MRSEALEYLKALIEEKYGSEDEGCYINGQWLSSYQIIELIDNADREH